MQLSNCRLTALPPELLVLHETLDTDKGDKWWECCEVTSIDAADNAIADVPPGLFTLEALTLLRLARNQITVLPDVLDMPNLKSLDVAGNGLRELPSLAALPLLVELDVSGNALAELPPLNTQVALEVLRVDGNKLRLLPDSIRASVVADPPPAFFEVDTLMVLHLCTFLPFSLSLSLRVCVCSWCVPQATATACVG